MENKCKKSIFCEARKDFCKLRKSKTYMAGKKLFAIRDPTSAAGFAIYEIGESIAEDILCDRN